MKERPILFSGPMVSAILAGTKTQTRRLARLTDSGHVKEPRGHRRWHPGDPEAVRACPYGVPGDRLVLLTTWAVPKCYDKTKPSRLQQSVSMWSLFDGEKPAEMGRNRPGRFMPAFLRVRMPLAELADVLVQRVQDISEDDAKAEGATRREWAPSRSGWSMDWSRVGTLSRYAGGSHRRGHEQPLTEQDICLGSAKMAFANFWNSINGKRAPWSSNPWVWALTFRRVRP